MIGATISHHKILKKLGSGGMGIFYKAHVIHLDRVIALNSVTRTSVFRISKQGVCA
jgi:hypothetical protein